MLGRLSRKSFVYGGFRLKTFPFYLDLHVRLRQSSPLGADRCSKQFVPKNVFKKKIEKKNVQDLGKLKPSTQHTRAMLGSLQTLSELISRIRPSIPRIPRQT